MVQVDDYWHDGGEIKEHIGSPARAIRRGGRQFALQTLQLMPVVSLSQKNCPEEPSSPVNR